MKELKKDFIGSRKSEVSGFRFYEIDRYEKLRLFKVYTSSYGNNTFHYEIIKIKHRKEQWKKINGKNIKEKAKERYPNGDAFNGQFNNAFCGKDKLERCKKQWYALTRRDRIGDKTDYLNTSIKQISKCDANKTIN